MPCPVPVSRADTPYGRTRETDRVSEVAVNDLGPSRSISAGLATPVERASDWFRYVRAHAIVTFRDEAGHLRAAARGGLARAEPDGRCHVPPSVAGPWRTLVRRAATRPVDVDDGSPGRCEYSLAVKLAFSPLTSVTSGVSAARS